MKQLLRAFRKMRFHYETLVEVRIFPTSLLHNLRIFEHIRPNVAVAPVLKSNAYGHGLVETARVFDTVGVPFMCVDSYFEAVILRNEKIRTPLLVIGYTPLANIHTRLSNVSFGIFSTDELRRVAHHAHKPLKIHLEIDTGMRRHGILPDELDGAFEIIASHTPLVLEGVFTHFADADTPNSTHAQTQVATWNALVPRIREKAPEVKYFHCGGTQAVSYLEELDLTTLRIGIGLYGFNTSLKSLTLEPALELWSRVTALRPLKAGERIGYNGIYTAPRDMTIATVAVGYYEGVERELSNKGSFLLHRVACPIVGRVSMNMTMIDVSHLSDVSIDDEVCVISKDPSAPNSLAHIAELTGVLPYELRIHIPAHLRRVVI